MERDSFMSNVTIAQPMQIGGTGDSLAMALKLFSGETLAALDRYTVTSDKFIRRTIQNGKSAQFPCFGRTEAHYLKAGENLDDKRTNIQNGERTIYIDGLLTSDCLIFDLDTFIAHYDFRSAYAKQLGEALAISLDASILAEAAKEALSNKENVTGLGKGGTITVKRNTGNIGMDKEQAIAIYNILMQARAKMSHNYVPKQGRYAFMSPDNYAALSMNFDFLNKNYGAYGTITESEVVRLCGFEIIECPHLTAGGADAANVLKIAGENPQNDGHAFPASLSGKDPIIICNDTSVGVLTLHDLAFETARRANLQADQIIAKMAVGVGGLRPEACFLGIVDNASKV